MGDVQEAAFLTPSNTIHTHQNTPPTPTNRTHLTISSVTAPCLDATLWASAADRPSPCRKLMDPRAPVALCVWVSGRWESERAVVQWVQWQSKG